MIYEHTCWDGGGEQGGRRTKCSLKLLLSCIPKYNFYLVLDTGFLIAEA